MGRPLVERKESIELLVKARLLDRQHRPDPQGQHYGLVMKYELLEIVKRSGGCPADFPYTTGEMFFVMHGVPELPRPSYHRVSG